MNNLSEKFKEIGLSNNDKKESEVKVEQLEKEHDEVHFFYNASIKIFINDRLPKSYIFFDNAFKELKLLLENAEYINMGYEPEVEIGDAVCFHSKNFTFFCATGESIKGSLRVFRIEKITAEYNIQVRNIFSLTEESNTKPNSHLEYLYFSLNVDRGIIKGDFLNEFSNDPIPIIFETDKVREEDIFYVKEYFKNSDYVELFKENETINIYIYGYKLKAVLSRNRNHLFVFNIVLDSSVKKKDFYVKCSIFKFGLTQEEVDNQATNPDVYRFWNRVSPKLEYCFSNVPDKNIELNFQAPKHNIPFNSDIENIKNEIIELFYRGNRAIIYTSTLKIEAIVHKTNFDVNEDLIRHNGNRENYNNYEKFLVKGSIFDITQGDIKQNRKDNHNLIYFLKNGCKKKEQQKVIENSKVESELVSMPNEQVAYNFKNIILSGVAGVGKTHNYKKLITLIENGFPEKDIFNELVKNEDIFYADFKDRVEFITFHQSYSYEEFIEGFRPNKHGGISIESGVFKDFVDKAKKDEKQKYYFVIDEINRGNISKVFGELITLIEDTKREKLSAKLPYSKENFTIPKNLFIIGTMNITDQSISKIDIALRRRFIFVNIVPKSQLVCEEFRERFVKLNTFIKEHLGDDYLIGHSYFMKCNGENLGLILKHQVIPLIQDYFYGDRESLDAIFSILDLKDSFDLI
jgi:hypothetical protein